ncbi:unnamed protein product [Peniophora sp. CBMAI 1063]|nr:unnamed protein product [Peniophora sp. CBMAI 1063]
MASLLERYGFLFVCLAFVIVMMGICVINRRRRRYALQNWPPLEYVPEGVPEDTPVPELSEVWLEDEKGMAGTSLRSWPALQPLCAVRISDAQMELAPTTSPISPRRLFHFAKREDAWVSGPPLQSLPAPEAVQAAFVFLWDDGWLRVRNRNMFDGHTIRDEQTISVVTWGAPSQPKLWLTLLFLYYQAWTIFPPDSSGATISLTRLLRPRLCVNLSCCCAFYCCLYPIPRYVSYPQEVYTLSDLKRSL